MKMKKRKRKKIKLKKRSLACYNKALKLKRLYYTVHKNNDAFILFIKHYKNILFLNKIISNIRLKENTDNILPSTFKYYQKDITIKPFWNDTINKLSKKLFLPTDENMTKIDNFTNVFKKTWFLTEFYKSKQDVDYEMNVNVDYNFNRKTKKTRIVDLYLDKKQKSLLKRFIGIYRYFYNRTIEYINNYDKKNRTSHYFINPRDEKTKINVQIPETLTYVNKKGVKVTIKYNPFKMENLRSILKNNYPEWLNIKYPSHLVDQAIKEACTAFTTNIKKYNRTHKIFDLKYKLSKNKNQTIKIDSVYFSQNKNSFFNTFRFNNEKVLDNIKSSDNFYIYEKKMSNLTWNKILNKWKLCILGELRLSRLLILQ
jgi:hypothetical protein